MHVHFWVNYPFTSKTTEKNKRVLGAESWAVNLLCWKVHGRRVAAGRPSPAFYTPPQTSSTAVWRSTPWLQPLSHSLEPTDVLEERHHQPSQEFSVMRILRHSLWLTLIMQIYAMKRKMYWKSCTAVSELGRVRKLDCTKRISSLQSPVLLPHLRATPRLPFISLQTVPVDRKMGYRIIFIIQSYSNVY